MCILTQIITTDTHMILLVQGHDKGNPWTLPRETEMSLLIGKIWEEWAAIDADTYFTNFYQVLVD